MATRALIIGKDKNGLYRYGQSYLYGDDNTEWLQKNLNTPEQVDEFLTKLTESGYNGYGRGVDRFGYMDSQPVILWMHENYNCGIAKTKEEMLAVMHLRDSPYKKLGRFDRPEYLSFWNGKKWLGVGWNTLNKDDCWEKNWEQFFALVENGFFNTSCPANTDNLGMTTDESKENCANIINEDWCINCHEEAEYFFDEGLYEDLQDVIKNGLRKACLSHFYKKAECIGLLDSEIEEFLRSVDYFRDFESVKNYYYKLNGIDTLADVDGVKEWCGDDCLLVDGKIMTLSDFLNLDSLSLDEFMDMQEDWFIFSNDPLTWLLIDKNHLDFFETVYGEEPDYQWEHSNWDGSKRIAPENRVA